MRLSKCLLIILITSIITACGLLHELKFTDNVVNVEIGMTEEQVVELCGKPKVEVVRLGFKGFFYTSKSGLIKGATGENNSTHYLVVFNSESAVLTIKDISTFVREETKYKIIGRRELDPEKLCKYYRERGDINKLPLCTESEK